MSSTLYNIISSGHEENVSKFQNFGHYAVIQNIISDINSQGCVSVELIQFSKKTDLYSDLEILLKNYYKELSSTEESKEREKILINIRNTEGKILNLVVSILIITCNIFESCDESNLDFNVINIVNAFSKSVLEQSVDVEDFFSLNMDLDSILASKFKDNANSFFIKSTLILIDDRITSHRDRINKARFLVERGELSAKLSGDLYEYARYLYCSGVFYIDVNLLDDGERCLLQALKLFSKLPDSNNLKQMSIGYVNTSIGRLFLRIKKYDAAKKYLKMAYNLAKSCLQVEDEGTIWFLLRTISNINNYYSIVGNGEKAILILNEAIALLRNPDSINDDKRYANLVIFEVELANAYYDNHQYSLAGRVYESLKNNKIRREIYSSERNYLQNLYTFQVGYARYFKTIRDFDNSEKFFNLAISNYEYLYKDCVDAYAENFIFLYINLGELFMFAKKYSRAHEEYKKARNICINYRDIAPFIDRQMIDVELSITQLHLFKEELEPARKYLNKILFDLNSKYNRESSFYKKSKCAALIFEGQYYQIKNDFDKSTDCYLELCSVYENESNRHTNKYLFKHAYALSLLASSYTQQSKIIEGVETYNKCIELYSDYFDANRDIPNYPLIKMILYRSRGFWLLNKKDKSLESINVADGLLNMHSEDDLEVLNLRIEISMNRGVLCEIEKKYYKSIDHYKLAISYCELIMDMGNTNVHDKLINAYNGCANAYSSMREDVTASSYYQKAIELLEYLIEGNESLFVIKYVSVLMNKGNACMKFGGFKEAKRCYSMAHGYLEGIFDENPNSVLLEFSNAKINLGNYYYEAEPNKKISLKYITDAIRLIWTKRDVGVFTNSIVVAMNTVIKWEINVEKYATENNFI